MNRLWQDWALQRDYRMVWAEPTAVAEVLAEIDARRQRNELEPRFDRENLSQFERLDEQTVRAMRTLVVIAVRRPAHRLVFKRKEGTVEAIVPPTYVNYRMLAEEIRADLESAVLRGKGEIRTVHVPLKLLAARLGLVRYGRNNVTYMKGWGSYHQLAGFLTTVDLQPKRVPIPSADEKGNGDRSAGLLQAACRKCRKCIEACPTGALTSDRFLVRAERCLTLVNEQAGAWPDWIPASAHQCLVGCLACQRTCPVNRDRLQFENLTTVFSEAETARILAGDGNETEPAWSRIEAKLTEAGLKRYVPVLTRNLRTLAG
jgi:epoxyqueuosine reductase